MCLRLHTFVWLAQNGRKPVAHELEQSQIMQTKKTMQTSSLVSPAEMGNEKRNCVQTFSSSLRTKKRICHVEILKSHRCICIFKNIGRRQRPARAEEKNAKIGWHNVFQCFSSNARTHNPFANSMRHLFLLMHVQMYKIFSLFLFISFASFRYRIAWICTFLNA